MTERPGTRTTIPRILLAAALLAGRAHSGFSADGWQAEPEPVLIAGQLTDWDDFQVESPCVVPVDKGWRMYFEGTRLDEEGLTQGIGVAMSDDGRNWRKHENNPVVSLESPDELRLPTKRLVLPVVCRLPDKSWLMTCTETDQNHGTLRLRVLRSADGLTWQSSPESDADLAKATSGAMLFSPSFCPNPHRSGRLQLWCLKQPDGGNINDVKTINTVMFQTVDGKGWKQVIERPLTEIEPTGSVRDIRFVVDGETWVVCYLFAETDAREPALIRFRKSADAIRWKPAGIPDYALPATPDGEKGAALSRPGLLLGESGVRIYYTEQQENGSRWIASALIPKASPRTAP
ncbi:MAG: hypothetical protein WD648_08565 [Planctomycetaceae bacterium]